MFGFSWKIVFLFLLGVSFCSIASCTTNTSRSVRALKGRLRLFAAPWRILVCLTQSQSSIKTDIQKVWEKARLESSHADMNVSYIEAPPKSDSLSYPLTLLNKFCTEIKGEKTVLSLIIGGGSSSDARNE